MVKKCFLFCKSPWPLIVSSDKLTWYWSVNDSEWSGTMHLYSACFFEDNNLNMVVRAMPKMVDPCASWHMDDVGAPLYATCIALPALTSFPSMSFVLCCIRKEEFLMRNAYGEDSFRHMWLLRLMQNYCLCIQPGSGWYLQQQRCGYPHGPQWFLWWQWYELEAGLCSSW